MCSFTPSYVHLSMISIQYLINNRMKSKIRDQTGNKRKQNNHQKNPSVNQFLFPFPQTRTDPVTCDKEILPSNLKQKCWSLFKQTQSLIPC
jgi:hypothetical protein